MSYCAIDFGTSNSAIAIPAPGDAGMRLVPLENGQPTMPTAVFYCTDADDLPPSVHRPPLPELPRTFGRAAVQAYVDGYEGRLMRSMKSVLGTALIDQTTEVGHGHGVKYLDIVTGYLRHLRTLAEADGGQPLTQAVLGRPVFFVDDEPERDAQAQASLEAAARAVGFADIAFQYEPIAAALDHEQRTEREEIVLVADIGGGTSDFSVVRVGPGRAHRTDRRDDILASHGVHIAGTDFDRRVSLGSVMPPLGFGAFGPEIKGQPPRPVPSRVYFDLSTWHLVNTVYAPQRVAELANMIDFYGEPVHHQRLMSTVRHRLGHALLGRSESAKIAVAEHGVADIDLAVVEPGLRSHLDAAGMAQALRDDLDRIVACARDTVARAGLQPDGVDAVYFTGGSTGLGLLTDGLAAAFPTARSARGDRLASVATGLGLYAKRLFGA
ncbi:Hsp70 family protein [Aquabacterium soli]|uniref:Hsp70 family protein n=1 Tax=Aquabacterium soli TaxID=2493092 RepID=A0A426VAH9_9BURK|nr:Hsp70 family protein [Aquabacterium soli]RRS03864.1 Hsp70 family protein [Aquabacterium soli]